MLIQSSDLWLGARHASERHLLEISEISATRSAGPGAAEVSSLLRSTDEQLEISAQALSLSAASTEAAVSGVEEEESVGIEPRMLLLAKIVAHFFRRDVVIFVMQPPEPETTAPLQEPEVRTDFEVRQTVLRAEAENTRFEARGTVQTADGRQIEIDVELNLSRSFVEMTRLDLAGVERRLEDPLVINLDVGSAELDATRFRFDLDANGQKDELPTLGPGSGYLVLDRNGNGRVDDGSELFGALSGDGFADLRAYDADENGWIDRADPVFSELQVWIGAGSDSERLKSLHDLGIGAIYLGAANTPFSLNDQRNDQLGQLRSTGVFLYEEGKVGTVQQLDLAV